MLDSIQSLPQGSILTLYGILCYAIGMAIGAFITWSFMR